jgi:D-glycero-alpha-D-manno-heptose-7-phosphate kinase
MDIGMAGGKQDQYAAAFGGFNFMEFYKDNHVIVNPLRIKETTVNELENALVLYYSGASRESATIIKEQIKNAESKNAKAVEAMHKVKEDSLTMKEHLLRGNIIEFAQCLGKSWESKKGMAHSISNVAIEKVFNIALDNGAIAGKVSGAGGGGYMMFFTSPTKRMDLVKALKKLHGDVVNVHFAHNGVQTWTAGNY